MPKTRQQKELSLADLGAKLGSMKAIVFTKYDGLTVKEVTELRTVLRKENVEYVVAKKTLLRRALADQKLDPSIVDQLEGAVAMAFGYEDEVLPAKLLQKFSVAHQAVKLVGGVVNGAYITGPQVIALSKLPGREEMIAKTVWTIKGPLTGLVNVLAGNMRSLVTILQAIKDKQPA